MKLAGWALDKRATMPHPGDDYWYQPIGWQTQAGVPLSPEGALRSSAVFGCRRLISGALSQIPLLLYKFLPGGGKERADTHPLYSRLRYQPNRWQTAFEWREFMTSCLMLRGNGYSRIIPGPGGAVDELVPILPAHVKPEWTNGIGSEIRYVVSHGAGRKETLGQDEVFHLRLYAPDGLIGLSPISAFREGIGITLAAQKYNARFFGAGNRPAGVLSSDQRFTPEQAEQARQRWAQFHGSPDKTHEVAVLGAGLKWQQIGMSHEDAQMLETLQLTDRQICGHIYGVPPHMVGDSEKVTSWGTGIEQLSIGFVVYTLAVYGEAWHQAVRRDLLAGSDKDTHFAEHLYAGLLKGDLKSRYEAYQIAVNANDPWLTVNQILEFENMNPIPGGDRRRVPLNTEQARTPENGDRTHAEGAVAL